MHRQRNQAADAFQRHHYFSCHIVQLQPQAFILNVKARQIIHKECVYFAKFLLADYTFFQAYYYSDKLINKCVNCILKKMTLFREDWFAPSQMSNLHLRLVWVLTLKKFEISPPCLENFKNISVYIFVKCKCNNNNRKLIAKFMIKTN